MRVLVFGAGAMGSFIGGVLSGKNDVTLVGRKEHVEAILKNGLEISGRTNIVVHPKVEEELSGQDDFDLIIISTKAYDTEEATQVLTPYHKKAIFLSLQNGLDNEEIISQYATRVVGGVTRHGVTLKEPGKIFHAGIGSTAVGNYCNAEEYVNEIATTLTESGIKTDVSRDIRRDIWKKVIVNAGINPLTAITGQKNGFILENPNLEMTLEAICEEGTTVANAYGIDITIEEAIAQTKKVARLTAENKSSMLQDIERGKKTEVDSICGAIARLGREKGIPTPVNLSLMAVVKGIERADRKIQD